MKKLLFIIPPYFNVCCRTKIETQLLDLNVTLQKLIDQRFEGDYAAVFGKEIESRLKEFNPQFVGVSALFNSSNRYIQHVAQVCKNFNSGIITLAGGGFTAMAAE